MVEKVKIGIVGLGGIAQLVHLPLLSKMNEVAIAGISEINKAKLNTISDKFSIQNAFTDYEKMLENLEIDGVIISTPTNTHKDIALKCLQYNKPLLVEKPLSSSISEAEEIINTSIKSKMPVLVGMNMRFRPDLMILKSIINSGEIGNPFFIKCGWIRPQSSEGKWFTKKEVAGGGVLFDLGIVILDLAMWFLNFPEVKTVSTQNYSLKSTNVEDSSISFIRTFQDSIISMETSWSFTSEKDTFYMDIYCSKGFASVNPLRILKKENTTQIDLTPFRTENPATLFKKSYENEIRHFISLIKGNTKSLSPANESLSRLRIIESMYKSSQQKMEINL